MTKKSLGRKALKILYALAEIPPVVWRSKKLILVSALTLAASIIGQSAAGFADIGRAHNGTDELIYLYEG